jgi:hypothetical protein
LYSAGTQFTFSLALKMYAATKKKLKHACDKCISFYVFSLRERERERAREREERKKKREKERERERC